MHGRVIWPCLYLDNVQSEKSPCFLIHLFTNVCHVIPKVQLWVDRNSFTVSVLTIIFPFMSRQKFLFSLRPRKIIWNLSGFATMLFSLNQEIAPSISNSRHAITSSISLPHANTVLSSAKLYTWELCIANTKSLMNILNSKGPRTEPWGTPDTVHF